MARNKRTMPWNATALAMLRAVAIGAGGSLLLYYIARLVGAMPQDVYVQDEQPLTVGAVIVTTVVVTILGALVFRLLTWMTQDPIFYFRIVAATIFILMIPAPMRIPEAPPAMIATLLLMHVVVTVAVVASLERGYRQQRM